MQVQIKDPQKYHKEYDDVLRFISYYYQISIIKKIKPDSILEIGLGNRTLNSYLKNSGFKVQSCDFDARLNPDIIGDIRELPISDNAYGTTVAFEVLEHIPWDDVDKALSELHRVTKNQLVISIPYASTGFEIVARFPLVQTLTGRKFLDLFLRIPFFFRKHKFYGQHYWEMGSQGYPISKIRKALKKYFIIQQEIRPILNYFHYFFVLEKKP